MLDRLDFENVDGQIVQCSTRFVTENQLLGILSEYGFHYPWMRLNSIYIFFHFLGLQVCDAYLPQSPASENLSEALIVLFCVP